MSEFQTTQLPLVAPKLRDPPANTRKVPHGLPRHFFLGMACGSRGSGKTTAVLQLLKMYDACKPHSVDRIYLWSPTYEGDNKQRLLETDSHNYDLRVYGRFNNSDFAEVCDEIEGDLADYDDYEAQLKVWNKFLHCKDPRKLPGEVLEQLELMDWKPPVTPWKHGRPCYVMILDDQIGNRDLYSANMKSPFTNWAVIHRHRRCSILFAVQTHKNGVPKQLRANLSLLMLWGCKNKSIRESAAQEYSSIISPADFEAMWADATQERHGWLMCDFDGPPELRFRRGFSEPYLLDARGNPITKKSAP